jgi:hypothetical protein
VTPSSATRYFNPVNYTYGSLSSNQTGQGFTGTECYGNQFLISEDTAEYAKLDSTITKAAIRFSPRTTQIIEKLYVYKSEYGTSPSYRYGLQSDVGGVPSGTWLDGNSYEDKKYAGTGWSLSDIPDISLTAGTSYYIVVYTTDTIVDSANCIGIRMSKPANFKSQNDNSPNSADAALFYDGTNWNKVSDSCGIYILAGASSDEGNSYAVLTDVSEYYSVCGSTWVGTEFVVQGSTLGVNKIGFYVKKYDTPECPLYYDLRGPDSFSTFIESGTFANVGDVTTSYSWISKSLESTRDLAKDGKYWLMLKSSGTTGQSSANSYVIGINNAGLDTALYGDKRRGDKNKMDSSRRQRDDGRQHGRRVSCKIQFSRLYQRR